MQSAQTRLGKITPYLFFVAGAVWLGLGAESGEIVLIWPGVTSIIAGASHFFAAGKPTRRPIAVASSLFGLPISLYQVYLAAGLLGTPYSGVAAYSLPIFAGVAALQIVLLYLAARL